MNRRGFLGALGAMISGVVLEQAIPFNRVWSFPTEIKTAKIISLPELAITYYDRKMIENLRMQLVFGEVFTYRELPQSDGRMMKLFDYQT